MKNFLGNRATFLIILTVVVFFLPFLVWPQLLLNRNNDMVWFFQNFSFFKDQLVNFHHLPLWQNQILSGSPYLGDPQNPLLYLPNYLSLLMPLPAFMLVFFLGHYLLAGLGIFFLARKLRFGVFAAFFSATTYALSPAFSAHLADGHLNMMAAFAWLPFFIAGVYALTSTKPKVFQAFQLGISAAAIFLNYLTVFIYALPAALAVIILKRKLSPLFFVATGVFLLISLPQILVSLNYFSLTTRNLMTLEDVYPLFISTRKFLWSIINPYSFGVKDLGAETTLAFGIFPMIAAAFGFVFIKTKYKILLLFYLALSLFLALNLKSPGYSWLVSTFPLLLMFRVATRFWFISILLVSLLGGYFLEKKFRLKFQLLFCFLAFAELVFFGWYYFYSHPSVRISDSEFSKLAEPLLNQPDYFRVYCLSGCPVDADMHRKGTANGYNPVQMKNYFDFLARAAGYRFGSYAYGLPPYQTYPDKPQPKSELMGLLGVKYIFSPYLLDDPGLVLINSGGSQLLYENQKIMPRAFTVTDTEVKNLQVANDLPGDMEILLDPNVTNVVINEPYMPLWRVTDQNGKVLPAQPYNQILLSVKTDNATKITASFAPLMKILVALSFLASLAGFIYLFSLTLQRERLRASI